METTIQKLSKAEFQLIQGLIEHYLSSGKNPEDGLTMDEILVELSKIETANQPSQVKLIDGIIEFLKPIAAKTPTIIDDVILQVLDVANDAGAFKLVKAWIPRIRSRRELKKLAKETVK